MPAPAIYVLAVVGTVAVGIVFKEFIYDPHIAPKFEQWRQDISSHREARRRRRQGVPIPVSSSQTQSMMSERERLLHHNDTNSDSDSDSTSGPRHTNRQRQRPSDEMEMDTLSSSRLRSDRASTSSGPSAAEDGVLQWRTGVETATLRKRNNVGSSKSGPSSSSSTLIVQQPHPTQGQGQLLLLQQQTMPPTSLPSHSLPPIMPMDTHILTDTDTVTDVFTETDTDIEIDAARNTTNGLRRDNLQLEDMIANANRLSLLSSLDSLNNLSNGSGSGRGSMPTMGNVIASQSPFADPDPSSSLSFLNLSYASPSLVPSLSLSHPIPRADIEDGVELLSAPTSRAMSPHSVLSVDEETFSNFSFPSESDAESNPTQNKFGVGSVSASGSESGYSSLSSPGAQMTTYNGVRNATTGSSYLTREQIQHLIDSSSTYPTTPTTPIAAQNSNFRRNAGGASPSPRSTHAPAPVRVSSSLRSRTGSQNSPSTSSLPVSRVNSGSHSGSRSGLGTNQRRPLGSDNPMSSSQVSSSSYASFSASESNIPVSGSGVHRSGVGASSPPGGARASYFSPFAPARSVSASTSSSATSSPRLEIPHLSNANLNQTQVQNTNANVFALPLRSDSDVFALNSHSSSESDFSLQGEEDDDDGVLSLTSSSLSGDDSDFEHARRARPGQQPTHGEQYQQQRRANQTPGSGTRNQPQSHSQLRYHDHQGPSVSSAGFPRGQGQGRRSSESGSDFSLV